MKNPEQKSEQNQPEISPERQRTREAWFLGGQINSLKEKESKTKEDYQELTRLYQKLEKLYGEGGQELESPIAEQYEKQVAMLERLGITKRLNKWGGVGIEGVDGKEYLIPTLKEITERIEMQKELMEKKEKQGFTRLLLVPFGVNIENLTAAYRKSILEHHQKGKLFTAKKDANDSAEQLVPLELDEDDPLYVWDGYQDEEIVYWPQKFSENHGGKTKEEILKERSQKNEVTSGWDIIFVEDNPNIPRQGNAKTVGDRTQIDTKGWGINQYMKGGENTPSPEEYLKAFRKESQDKNSVFQGEQGMTPEDQLMYAITYLEDYDQIIDDYRGNGSISYQIGAYFPSSGVVPDAYWGRGDRRASVYGSDAGNRNDDCGVRPAVRI